jgi:hypothetical protein
MGTYGVPADSFAQQRGIGIEQGPSPPVSVSPAPGPSASPPAVKHDKAMAWEAPVVTVLPIRATPSSNTLAKKLTPVTLPPAG